MQKVLIMVIVTALLGCSTRRPPLKTGFEGTPLPEFSILLHDSVTYVNTGDIPRGKPVVLFYFSPRCVYCRAEMASIIDNIASLKNIRFYIFTSWPFGEMKDFYQHYQLSKYPNIVVGEDYTRFFSDHFNIRAIPYTAIYQSDKRLNQVFLGKVDPIQIKEVAEN